MFIPLSELLTLGRADDHPVAYGKDGKTYRFKTFREDVQRNAARLRADRGAQIVLATDDSYLFSVGLLAILHAECHVVLPVNGQPGTLKKHRDAGASVLSDEELSEDPGEGGMKPGSFDLSPLPSNDRFISFFTSGSTGTPQRIEKKLEYLEREATVLERYWGSVVADATVLAMVSHQHLYGLTFKILWPLSSGRPFAAETFPFWEYLVSALKDPCCVVSSPAHLARFPPLEPLTAHQRPRMIVTAGAPLSHDDAKTTEQVLGVLPTEIFGSTETGVVAWRHQDSEAEPWTLFDVVQGMLGEDQALKIKSDLIDADDWYQMNDQVSFFDDGSFALNGRADRIVKIDGKRVSLPEIEAFLTAHRLIDEAAVVVLDDLRGSLAAVVALSQEGWPMKAQQGGFRFNRLLRDAMRPYFDQSALPRRWRFVDHVPVNKLGKRLESDLKALFS